MLERYRTIEGGGGGEGEATMKRVAQSGIKWKWTMYNSQVQVLRGYLSHCLNIHGKSCTCITL